MSRLIPVMILLTLILCSSRALDAVAEDFLVFHANFTGDTVDQWPDPNPVGDPATDSIWYYGISGDGTALVLSSLWELTNKPLVISRPSGSHIQVYMSFDPDHVDCGSYTVRFDAMAANPLEFAYFTFREEGLRPFASIALTDDPLPEVSGQGPITIWSSSNETSARWYEADAQSFRLEFDFSTSTFDLYVDDVAVPEAQARPLAVANHDGTFKHMGIQFGGLKDAVLAVDNLEVVAHCGQVETSRSNWGTLKSLW